MDRKIRRPAGALYAGPAARIGKGFAHLSDGRLGEWPEETGIGGTRAGRSGHPPCRQETRSNKPQPVCHVVPLPGCPDSATEARAFSSEVDTGSREENASKQESRAPFRLYRNGL
jgi:hypothetical protein